MARTLNDVVYDDGVRSAFGRAGEDGFFWKTRADDMGVGAIACGHPPATTGIRLLAQLARGFRERPDVRHGLTTLCIGLGMGAAVLWENVQNGG